MYNLVNTLTNEILKENVNLSEKEKNILNYSYNLNSTYLRYISPTEQKETEEEVELNLFTFRMPI